MSNHLHGSSRREDREETKSSLEFGRRAKMVLNSAGGNFPRRCHRSPILEIPRSLFFGKLRPIPGKTKILDEIMMCFYVFFPKKLDIWWTRNVHILSHVMSGWPTKTVTQKEFLRRISGEEQSHHQPGGARAPPSEMAVNIAEQGAVGWIMFLYVVVFFFLIHIYVHIYIESIKFVDPIQW